MRPPPLSTLFPYTTLFRSLDVVGLLDRAAPVRLADGELHRVRHPVRVHHHFPAGVTRGAPDRLDEGAPAPEEALLDRKSTRLNSSHVEISYAVFCLKKKNI